MSGADEVQRRIAQQLATAARSSRQGWVSASTYVRKYLAAHASDGGVLDEIVTDVGFIGAADPQHLVPELASLAASDDPAISGIARAYLRLGEDRVGIAFGQRVSNFALSCAADEPGVRLNLARVSSVLPWRVNFVEGLPSPFHAAPQLVSQDLVALAADAVDGQPVIATADLAHHVHVWDGLTGELIATWRAHYDAIRGLRMVSAAGRTLLVSGSLDGTICAWHPITGHLEQRIVVPSPVSCLAVGGEGSPAVAAGSNDGSIRTWELMSARPLASFRAHRDAVTSLDYGRDADAQILVSGGLDRIVNVWNVSAGERVLGLAGPTGSILDVVTCRLGQRVAVAAASSDESIWVWDGRTGEELMQFKQHSGAVTCLSVAQVDGAAVLASGSADMTVRLWDLSAGVDRGTLLGHLGGIRAVCATLRNGRPVLITGAADRAIRVWDLETGRGIAPSAPAKPGSAIVLAWGDSGSPEMAMEAASVGPVRCVAVGKEANETYIVAGARRGWLQVREAAKGSLMREWHAHEGGVLAVALSQLDEHRVIVSGGDDNVVRIWNWDDGALLRQLTGHTHSVWGVTVGDLHGQPIIVSGSRDRTARVWDGRTGREILVLEGSQERLWGVACAEIDGRTVIAAGSTDRTVWIWDAHSGRSLSRLYGHTRGVRYVSFARLRGRPVLAASGADRDITVWDPSTGSIVATLKGHGDGVWGLSAGTFRDRSVLASASDDLTVRVWDLQTGRSLVLPQASPAYAVQLSDDILAIGTDRHIVSLDLEEQLFDEMSG